MLGFVRGKKTHSNKNTACSDIRLLSISFEPPVLLRWTYGRNPVLNRKKDIMLGNGLCVGIHIEPRMQLMPTYAFLVILLTPRDANATYRTVLCEKRVIAIKSFRNTEDVPVFLFIIYSLHSTQYRITRSRSSTRPKLIARKQYVSSFQMFQFSSIPTASTYWNTMSVFLFARAFWQYSVCCCSTSSSKVMHCRPVW